MVRFPQVTARRLYENRRSLEGPLNQFQSSCNFANVISLAKLNFVEDGHYLISLIFGTHQWVWSEKSETQIVQSD